MKSKCKPCKGLGFIFGMKFHRNKFIEIERCDTCKEFADSIQAALSICTDDVVIERVNAPEPYRIIIPLCAAVKKHLEKNP